MLCVRAGRRNAFKESDAICRYLGMAFIQYWNMEYLGDENEH